MSEGVKYRAVDANVLPIYNLIDLSFCWKNNTPPPSRPSLVFAAAAAAAAYGTREKWRRPSAY